MFASTGAVKKKMSWDRAYYVKKKSHVPDFKLAAAAATATAAVAAAADPAAAAAATSAVAAAADPWSFNTGGTLRTPAAQKTMKY